jgi:WD40 repeat protein
MSRLCSCFSPLLLLSCCLIILPNSCIAPDATAVSTRTPLMGATLSTYAGHRNAVTAVAWSPDGKRLASASYDTTVQVWQSCTGKPLLTYHGHSNWVTAVAWSPDGKELASAGLDTTVQLWNVTNGKAVLTYLGHAGIVTALVWSPMATISPPWALT